MHMPRSARTQPTCNSPTTSCGRVRPTPLHTGVPLNIELYRPAHASPKARTVRWNAELGCLELAGAPPRCQEVTTTELQRYMGWLVGPFCAGKQVVPEGRQQDLAFLGMDQQSSGQGQALDRWQAMWTDLPVRARALMTSYGFLGCEREYRRKVAAAARATEDFEIAVVTLFREGGVQGTLWLDNLSRYIAHLEPSRLDGHTFMKADYTVACVMAVPLSTNTLDYSELFETEEGAAANPTLGYYTWVHEDIISHEGCTNILEAVDKTGKTAELSWNYIWKVMTEKKALSDTQRRLAGDDPALLLLPQHYIRTRAGAVGEDDGGQGHTGAEGGSGGGQEGAGGGGRKLGVWSCYNSTFPMDCMDFACGSVEGKGKMLDYINRVYRVFAARGQCLVMVLDWDTWRTVMRAILDSKGRGRHLAKYLVVTLDHFHMLKYLTHATVELLSPILPLLLGIMTTDPNTLDQDATHLIGRRAAKTLKGQQTLVSVLYCAYCQVREVCGEAIIQNRTTDNFQRYLYDVFEVALPMCVAAWLAYRNGRRGLFSRCMCSAVPLLMCMHHPQYAAGVVATIACEVNSLFALKDWMKDQYPTFSAELCEMTLRPLSRKVRRNPGVLRDPDVMRKSYIWEHHRARSAESLNRLWRRNEKKASRWDKVVYWDDIRVCRLSAWLRDLLVVCAKYSSKLTLPTRLKNYPGWTCMKKQVMRRVRVRVTRWFSDTLPGQQYEGNSDVPDFFQEDYDAELAAQWRRHAADGRKYKLEWQTEFADYVQGDKDEEPPISYFSTYITEHKLPQDRFVVKDRNLWSGDMVLGTTLEDLRNMKIKDRLTNTIDVDYEDFQGSTLLRYLCCLCCLRCPQKSCAICAVQCPKLCQKPTQNAPLSPL